MRSYGCNTTEPGLQNLAETNVGTVDGDFSGGSDVGGSRVNTGKL